MPIYLFIRCICLRQFFQHVNKAVQSALALIRTHFGKSTKSPSAPAGQNDRSLAWQILAKTHIRCLGTKKNARVCQVNLVLSLEIWSILIKTASNSERFSFKMVTSWPAGGIELKCKRATMSSIDLVEWQSLIFDEFCIENYWHTPKLEWIAWSILGDYINTGCFLYVTAFSLFIFRLDLSFFSSSNSKLYLDQFIGLNGCCIIQSRLTHYLTSN